METIEQLLSKAEAGDVWSCYALGQMFATGNGTDADETKAFEWYLRAAKAGHPTAQFIVATCYSNGIVTEPDCNEASMWHFRALMNGNLDSYRALSDYYETHDTPEDGAVFEYFSARSQEDPSAALILGRLYELGVGTDFDPVAAKEMFDKAAEMGELSGEY